MSFILNPYRHGGAAASLFLDTYGTNIHSAGAFWLIRADYSGALCRLRRSTDNAEKDFYPDSNDELSMSSEDGAGTSLSTWIGANTAYLKIIYDQSTNGYNAEQTTTSLQRIVVNAGSLVTLNGKASANSNSDAAAGLKLTTNISGSQPYTMLAVGQKSAAGETHFINGDNNNSKFLGQDSAGNGRVHFGAILTDSAAQTGQVLLYGMASGTSSEVATNGAAATTGDASTSGMSVVRVGGKFNGGDKAAVDFQFYAVYAGDNSADKSGMETVINDYYSIY